LIFRTDSVVNLQNVYISAIFIEGQISIDTAGKRRPLTVGGMYESTVAFDTESDRVFETYVSNVLCTFNTTITPTRVKSQRSAANPSKNITLLEGGLSQTGSARITPITHRSNRSNRGVDDASNGARSYSSVSDAPSYEIRFTLNNVEYAIKCFSLREVKDFFDSIKHT
jgi:hypothetical protein